MRRLMPSRDESGFSMAEVTITLGILAILVLSMSTALSSGFRYLLTAKQRAAAVTEANAIVERARAVARADFDALGLAPHDLAGDDNISAGTCAGQTAQMFSGEPVVTSASSANPLDPHVRTTKVGATDVTLKVYVTGVTETGCSATNPTYKRVTVLASWARGQDGVSSQVRLATYMFDTYGGSGSSSPSGPPLPPPSGCGPGIDDDGDGQVDEDVTDGVDNDGDAQVDEDGNTPCGTITSSTPDFDGGADFTGGFFQGENVSPLLVPPPPKTTMYFTRASAQGKTAGALTTYAGSADSVLAETGGQTVQHSASTEADNDPATPAPATEDPPCNSGTWSDFAGGLINSNLASTGQSCSTVSDDATDNFPLSTSTVSFTSAPSWISQVPEAGSIPASIVNNFAHAGATSATATLDAVGSGGVQTGLLSTVSRTTAAIDINRFSILGWNASQGVFSLGAGTWSTTAKAGDGVTGGESVLSGAITYRIYDPDATLTGCTSRSGDYCVRNVDPTVPGFSGHDTTSNVIVQATNILGVVTARITMTTTVSVPAPVVETKSENGDVVFAKVAYQLPKVTSIMVIESPGGVTISNITSVADFGQLISVATYIP